MQVIDRRKAMSIPPLLRLGFRPFFLAGALFAALALPLWIIALHGGAGWQPSGGWLAWHRHELVFGFGLAIIAGFLLTAVQTWTGLPGLSGKPLAALALLWLAARVGWLAGMPALPLLVLELIFPLVVALVMARMLFAVRQKKNYPVVAVLVLLALADGLSMLGLLRGDDGLQRQGVLAGVWLIAAMLGLIGGRVIPFFTQRGVGRVEAFAPIVWLDWALLIGAPLVAILYAAGLGLTPSLAVGVLFALLGIGHLLRLARWQDKRLWRVPLLWSLHLAYAWLAVACLGMAAWNFGWLASPSPATHALNVGAMGGLILAMIARVSLGHTGRPLRPPKAMIAAFILLQLGTLARVLLVEIWPLGSLHLAATCWAVAFGLFVIFYAPMLCRTRADGHPG